MTFTPTILAAYGAAAIGFLFVEVVKVSKRQPRNAFNLRYYISQNWENLLMNVLASIGLLFGLPEIGRLETKYIGDDYTVLTGLGIGTLGSMALRGIIDSAKNRIPEFLKTKDEQTPPQP